MRMALLGPIEPGICRDSNQRLTRVMADGSRNVRVAIFDVIFGWPAKSEKWLSFYLEMT